MRFTDPNAPVETIPLKQKGAFMRWRKIQLTPISERFWRKVSKKGKDECWPYIGATDAHNYGVFSPWADHKGRKLAHRAAWEFTNGPIPDGMYICHTCDNPPCCNPAHMFCGTQLDNMRDAAKKKRFHPLIGENHCWAKLTERDVVQMRKMYSPGIISVRTIAKLFGISYYPAYKAISRQSWKHVI